MPPAPPTSPTPPPAPPQAPANSLPVFQVAQFGASGSNHTLTCSGVAGATILTACSGETNDFAAGQGLMVLEGGSPAATSAIFDAPKITPVTPAGQQSSGSHTYCYIVFTVDPLDGVSAPSPQTCVGSEPMLSYLSTWNALQTATSAVGPSPTFLWYASMDGGDFQLVCTEGFASAAMDVGQRPLSRGGWPTRLPLGNYNIAHNQNFFTTVVSVSDSSITLADPLPSSVGSTTIYHDDTAATQAAINAAVAANGGVVQFSSGTYGLRRPSFLDIYHAPLIYPGYTTALSLDPSWAQFSRLYIPNGAVGHVHLEGVLGETTLVTPADHGGDVTLLAVGNFERSAYATGGRFKMDEVAKGATAVVITQSLTGDTLSVGDDVWLYSGSFGLQPCPDQVDHAGDCHYSELNTVAAVSGNTITLRYPTSKRYYDDGGSSFGLVKMPVTPHDVALEHLQIETYDPITFTGNLFGLHVNDVHIDGFVSHVVFGGGFKRDLLIENSSWGFGAGDVSYSGTDEFDQVTNATLTHNTITGYAAPGAEGPSVMARIYGTEGSSQFTITNNTLVNASIYFDQTTDDVITDNNLTNGVISVGYAFGNQAVPFDYGYNHDPSFTSYGSQTSLVISRNTIQDDATFVPPYIIRGGHYTTSAIDNNVITYQGPRTIPAIYSYSGEVSSNRVTLTGSTGSVGVALVGDEAANAPASSFLVQGNVLNIANGYSGFYIVDPGFTDTAPMCLTNNTVGATYAGLVAVQNPASVVMNCQ